MTNPVTDASVESRIVQLCWRYMKEDNIGYITTLSRYANPLWSLYEAEPAEFWKLSP